MDELILLNPDLRLLLIDNGTPIIKSILSKPKSCFMDGGNGGQTQLIDFNVLQPPRAQPHQKVTQQLIFLYLVKTLQTFFSDICLFLPPHIDVTDVVLIREFCEYL